MTHNYVDSNLCDFKDQIMDIWAARRAEKRYFPDSALSGKIDKDTLQKSVEVTPSAPHTNVEKSAASSDGKDDGKISFKEKMQNFGEGLVKPIKNIFASPKNMAITAATIAGGTALIALTSGAAAPVMVAAGLIGGAVQIGKGIYKQVNAKTDNDARQAWQEMGTGTFTLGVSAAGAKSSLKAAKVDGAKDMSVIKAAGKCIVDLPKNIKASVKNISSNIKVTPIVDVSPEPTAPVKPTTNIAQEPSVAPTIGSANSTGKTNNKYSTRTIGSANSTGKTNNKYNARTIGSTNSIGKTNNKYNARTIGSTNSIGKTNNKYNARTIGSTNRSFAIRTNFGIA